MTSEHSCVVYWALSTKLSRLFTVGPFTGKDYADLVKVNYCLGADDPKDEKIAASLSKQEQYGLKRTADWIELGSAYAREHGTRPATVGLALSASPLALLAWYDPRVILSTLC